MCYVPNLKKQFYPEINVKQKYESGKSHNIQFASKTFFPLGPFLRYVPSGSVKLSFCEYIYMCT